MVSPDTDRAVFVKGLIGDVHLTCTVAYLEQETRGRNAIERKSALVDMLAERHSERALPGAADVFHDIGFYHEVMDALAAGCLYYRKRVMARVAIEEQSLKANVLPVGMRMIHEAENVGVEITGTV